VPRLPVKLELADPNLLACEPSILESACEVETAEPDLLEAAIVPEDRVVDETPEFGRGEETFPRLFAVIELPVTSPRVFPAAVPRLAVAPALPEFRAAVGELVRLAVDPERELTDGAADRPPYAPEYREL